MKRGSLHSKRGMSLVEPLVAMVVLSFSLLGSVSMFALAQDGITVGARKLQAMALAETRIERSEEHTSELQSLAYLVCRLLLEKKKKTLERSRGARRITH